MNIPQVPKDITDAKQMQDYMTGIQKALTQKEIDDAKEKAKTYPIGSLYISADPKSPVDIYGGTWVAFGTGRTLVGIDTGQTEFDTIEKTGGEKAHVLTVPELAPHTHTIVNYWGQTYWGGVYNGSSLLDTTLGRNDKSTVSAGSGTAHNNLQPYITVYMWKRTAL